MAISAAIANARRALTAHPARSGAWSVTAIDRRGGERASTAQHRLSNGKPLKSTPQPRELKHVIDRGAI